MVREGGNEHVLFSDYRKAGGLTVPFRMTVYEGGALTAEYVWEKIEYDVPIDEAIFERDRPRGDASG